jgi:hypothetical protein
MILMYANANEREMQMQVDPPWQQVLKILLPSNIGSVQTCAFALLSISIPLLHAFTKLYSYILHSARMKDSMKKNGVSMKFLYWFFVFAIFVNIWKIVETKIQYYVSVNDNWFLTVFEIYLYSYNIQ